MTEIQTIFAAALAAAMLAMFWIDKPDWRLPVLFAVLLGLSVMHTGNQLALGLVDLMLAVVAMTFGTRRGYITAGLFAAMAATYATGALINVPKDAIYGVVELLCVACLGVMVNADRWGSGTRKRIGCTRRALGDAVGRDNTYGVGVNMLRSTQEKAR